MRRTSCWAVLIPVVAVLCLSACSGDGEVQSTPTIRDRIPSSQSESSLDDERSRSSSESKEPVYKNASDVIVDENGRRSFPAQTAEQTLDLYWDQFVASIDDGEIPERPDVDIVVVDEQEFMTGFVSCMNNAGWTSVRIDAGGYIDSGVIPAGQTLSYDLAEYTCHAKNLFVPPAPMDESDIERLYDHQVDYVIPCLAERGHQVSNFPSKETFVDRYFAERTYTLATAMAGLSDSERFHFETKDSSVDCHAFPTGLWD